VLVHGGGPDNAGISWFEVFGELARSRPVLALDLPGFGYTEGVPVDGSPVAMADLAVAVAGSTPAVWVGVSMGGDVVLNVALRHRVAGLVLVAPGGLARYAGNRVLHPLAWLAGRLPDAVLRPVLGLANRFTAVAVRVMVHDPATVPPRVRAEMVRESRRVRLGYLRYNQATVGPWRMRNDLSGRVGQIRAPALFLHGREDGLVDPGDSVRAAAAMPDARVVLLEGCGHWVQIEAREAFLAEIGSFLDRIDDEHDRGAET
jgi:pimeloyl-ACP methyl ester carboxylesterase